jgi:hypothetical protein
MKDLPSFLLVILDGEGVYGSLLHYGLIIALVGSAMLIFLYLWIKGRLDMDEEPKYVMFEANDHLSNKEEGT